MWHPLLPARSPQAAELVRLSGPLRGLAVPFAWTQLGNASARQNTRARRSPAWLLSCLLPERPEIAYDLAWERVYNDGALARDARGECETLLDALAILDEVAALDPENGAALAWQGFHLMTRCADQDGAQARRLAFEQLTGVDPIALADERLAEATRRSPNVNWTSWQRATALEFLAASNLESGTLASAAARLATAAELWKPSNPRRSSLLSRFSISLGPGSPALAADDLERLRQDHVFGRQAASWLRRYSERRNEKQKRR